MLFTESFGLEKPRLPCTGALPCHATLQPSFQGMMGVLGVREAAAPLKQQALSVSR